MVNQHLRHCNICDWYGDAFTRPNHQCPECGCTPMDRSLFRWMSDSTVMYRRLPALALGLSGKMAATWADQFQGPRLDLPEFTSELHRVGRLANSPGRLQLAALRLDYIGDEERTLVVRELKRLLGPGSTVLLQIEGENGQMWGEWMTAFEHVMQANDFLSGASIRYTSSAIRYSFVPLRRFVRHPVKTE